MKQTPIDPILIDHFRDQFSLALGDLLEVAKTFDDKSLKAMGKAMMTLFDEDAVFELDLTKAVHANCFKMSHYPERTEVLERLTFIIKQEGFILDENFGETQKDVLLKMVTFFSQEDGIFRLGRRAFETLFSADLVTGEVVTEDQ